MLFFVFKDIKYRSTVKLLICTPKIFSHAWHSHLTTCHTTVLKNSKEKPICNPEATKKFKGIKQQEVNPQVIDNGTLLLTSILK